MCARPSRSTSARRPPSSRRCARTSPTATAGCPARSRSSSATVAPCARWSTSCSTRRSATAPSAGSATARALLRRRRVEARPAPGPDAARTRRCTSSARRSRRLQEARRSAWSAIEAAAAARGAERARSAAKGADFEDLLETMLGDIARGAGDLLDRTGVEAGAVAQVEEGRLRPDRRPAIARAAATCGSSSRPRTGRCRCGRCATSCARRRENRGAAVGRRRLHAGPRADRDRAVQPRRRRRLLRHRPGGAGAGDPRGGGPAGAAAGARVAGASARSTSMRRPSVRPDRDPRAARGGASAQDAADLHLERDKGRVERPRHDARRHPDPGDGGRIGDPHRDRVIGAGSRLVVRTRRLARTRTTGCCARVGG